MTTIIQNINNQLVSTLQSALTRTLKDSSQVMKMEFIFLKNCVLGTQNEEQPNTLEGRVSGLLATLPTIAIFVALDVAYVFIMMPALMTAYTLENQTLTNEVVQPIEPEAITTPAQQTENTPWVRPKTNFAESAHGPHNRFRADTLIEAIIKLQPEMWTRDSLETAVQDYEKEQAGEPDTLSRVAFFQELLESIIHEETDYDALTALHEAE